MSSIVKFYNFEIKKFQEMENVSTEKEIHDKRVILRRIFSILAVYKIKSSKVKNGEKAFHLFGKLRDVQVQILKIESLSQFTELTDYLSFLKEQELKLKDKVSDFNKEKKLKFPVIKKEKFEKAKIFEKATKQFYKLWESTHIDSIDDAEDIHKIRIEFKKFRYIVEVIFYFKQIDESRLEELKTFQDQLGEIQDYEVLINGIRKYFKKNKPEEEADLEEFEIAQNNLIENFERNLEMFRALCYDIVYFDINVKKSDTKTGKLNTQNSDLKVHDEIVLEKNNELDKN